jgi:hypothetical protein
MSKLEVITFKADEGLAQELARVPNRSDFIRNAVLAALANACPLCRGTGVLTQAQKTHWTAFEKTHHVEECAECDAVHLVCSSAPVPVRHAGNSKAKESC